MDYIKKFRNANQDIPDEFYGEALERANRMTRQNAPKPEDFNLPKDKSEWDTMLVKLKECGIEDAKIVEMMMERKEKFDKALEEHAKNSKKSNVVQQN